MKKINFLIKLKKKKKLELVEPSEEIKKSYILKSESNLVSARILFKNDKLEEAIALTYYSMYHMLTALLFKIGVKCENHTASIILLKDVFDIDNSGISYAKKERIDKHTILILIFNLGKASISKNIIRIQITKNRIGNLKHVTELLQRVRQQIKDIGRKEVQELGTIRKMMIGGIVF